MKKKPASYDPAAIEKKWQKKWASSKIYKSTESASKKKYYVLDMFPYPSGEGLHVGHPKGYIATDIVSRMKRMQGMNVLHPMGFDAFGLPAENYAIKTKTHPAVAVEKNVERYKKQLELLGFDYDWSREVNTTDPAYYKWTQWIFLQLFKKGLAYESFEPINWCPSCKTGLANEDVEDGRCERCGTPVEKKPMRQWVLKITDYADKLLTDLDIKVLPNRDLLETLPSGEQGIFQQTEDAPGKVRPDKPFVSRDAIAAFVEHQDGGKFIVLKWKKVAWMTPVTGGTDGQDAETAARREILEETGFKNLELVKKADKRMRSTFFHVPKDENRTASFTCFHFKLKNDERAPVSAEEQGNHEITWVERAKVRETLTAQAQQLGWCMLMGEPFGADAKPLLDWPESIKELQKNWIGRSEGMVFTAPVKDTDLTLQTFSAHFEAFAADTFVVIAPDHPFLKTLVKGTLDEKKVLAFADEIVVKRAALGREEEKEPEGIFTGRYIVDPVGNGDLPIWVASFALADYGTGIVKCSVHDERDFAFAKKYGLKLKPVLFPTDPTERARVEKLEACYTDMKGGILAEPAEFKGKKGGECRKQIVEYLEKKGIAKRKTTYKLRDWVFSRQRYWGEPIPLIHCEKCGVVAVPEKDLPVELPKVKSYEPTGTGESPLAAIDKWVNVKCPQCGGKGKRETNTMPQWAGSCWYYLRYEDPKNKKAFVDPKKESYWSPVDLYVGGAEHATRHLIYARFWHKFLYDIGKVSNIEPFLKLQSVGLIMGEDGKKMSKRFGNVVNPDDIVATYGADTLRIYEMFMGPFDQQIAWSTSSMVGARRFIERVWKLSDKVSDGAPAQRIMHKTIKKVSEDIVGLRFNTAISALMICANELEKQDSVSTADFGSYLKLLAPFAPHVADELWAALGNKKSIHVSGWSSYDPSQIEDSEATVVLQVNGKARATFTANRNASKESLETAARALPEAKKWLEGKEIKRVIVIPGKLVNIVV